MREEFGQNLEALFQEESSQLLRAMRDGLGRLHSEEAADPETIQTELRRAAHTLKGGARATEQPEAEMLAESLERALKMVKPDQLARSSSGQEFLLQTIQLLSDCLDPDRRPASSVIQSRLEQLDQLPSQISVPETPAGAQSELDLVFRGEAAHCIQALRTALSHWGRPAFPAQLKQAATAAADLEGAARSTDQPVLEILAEHLKSLLRKSLQQNCAWSHERAETADQVIGRCHQIVAGESTPSAEQVMELLARIARAEEQVLESTEAVFESSEIPSASESQALSLVPSREVSFETGLRQTFKEEVEEKLIELGDILVALEQKPDPNNLESVFRHFHNLKGAARSVGAVAMEGLCQSAESLLAQVKKGLVRLESGVLDGLHETANLLNALGRDHEQPHLQSVRKCIALLDALAEGKNPAPNHSLEIPAISPQDLSRTDLESIRISSRKLQKLASQIQELLSLKLASQQRVLELRQINARLKNWENEWKRLQPRLKELDVPAAVKEFLNFNSGFANELKQSLTSLTRATDQDRRNTTALVDSTQEQSKRLLMSPFSTILGRFPKIARDLAQSLGKKVEVQIEGAELESDRRILERLNDPLLHLVRNAIDHGIEPPEQRIHSNKPAQARLKISVYPYRGSQLQLTIQDDGAGVDLSKVRQIAREKNLVSPQQAESASDQEVLQWIFLSDLSTRSSASEISGRGLGMAIVRDLIMQLGGSIQINSQRGKGTSLTISLPTTLATFRGILVKVSGQTFVFPTARVHRVLRIRPEQEIHKLEGKQNIFLNAQVLPIHRLSELLLMPSPLNPKGPYLTLILEAEQRMAALIVDEIVSEQEVLVRELKPPLSLIPHLSGISLLGTGELAPILNVSYLVQRQGPLHSQLPISSKLPKKPLQILLVDDSLTSRALLKSILESAGYKVETASDGEEALAALSQRPWDLVVSDIEMPRMNGLELTRHIRADRKRTGSLPVILVSTLHSDEDQQRGLEVGANAYVVKGNRAQTKLLEAIRSLL
ncbi:response regulator [bacterium]|nr:response regulator [bacterium]